MTLPLVEVARGTLRYKPHRFGCWNVTMHRMLRSSGVVRVEESDDVPVLRDTPMGKYGTFLRVDGAWVFLDTWDTRHPVISVDWSKYPPCKLVLKIQWEPGKFAPNVRPWTIFPSQEYPLGWFNYNPDEQHEYITVVSGVRRYGRSIYFDIQDDRIKVLEGKRPLHEFLQTLRHAAWGLSLKGRKDHDGKNRRETEFASCGIPLVLNYRPHYPFPFRPGKEFVFVNHPRDLFHLDRRYDRKALSAAAREIYDRYMSPAGAARLLLDLLAQT